MNPTTTIKSWAADDRPREKWLLKGKNALSDAELLAILLNSGTRQKSALELAQEILSSKENNLSEFSKYSFQELLQFNGVGEAKAITILAALEFGKRKANYEPSKKKKIESSVDLYHSFKKNFEGLNHEEFYILLTNHATEIIHTEQIAKGGLSFTAVDPKIIFKIALEHLATAVFLCHNHPSGRLTPSEKDLKLTRQLIDFGKMIELPVLDHLIFTDNGYFSFADSGLMN
jgi:DNA repair protein RadC